MPSPARQKLFDRAERLDGMEPAPELGNTRLQRELADARQSLSFRLHELITLQVRYSDLERRLNKLTREAHGNDN